MEEFYETLAACLRGSFLREVKNLGNLESNKKAVSEMREKFEAAQSVVIADYRGLTVAEVTDLRNQLRDAGVEYRVYKNTLLKIAAREAGVEGLDDIFKGPTAVAFGVDDPVAPAKVLNSFAKKHESLEIKAGVLENAVIDVAGVTALAELPSREELLAKLAGCFQGPLAGLVNVLQGPIRKTAYALEAVRSKQAEA